MYIVFLYNNIVNYFWRMSHNAPTNILMTKKPASSGFLDLKNTKGRSDESVSPWLLRVNAWQPRTA